MVDAIPCADEGEKGEEWRHVLQLHVCPCPLHKHSLRALRVQDASCGTYVGRSLHNPHFIQRILDMLPSLDKNIYGTIPRIEGMLSIALHETLDDPNSSEARPASTLDRPVPTTSAAARSHHPFFFLPSALSRILHCVSPQMPPFVALCSISATVSRARILKLVV